MSKERTGVTGSRYKYDTTSPTELAFRYGGEKVRVSNAINLLVAELVMNIPQKQFLSTNNKSLRTKMIIETFRKRILESCRKQIDAGLLQRINIWDHNQRRGDKRQEKRDEKAAKRSAAIDNFDSHPWE